MNDNQKINFDMNEVLNDSFRKGQKDAAKALFCMYQDFIKAGFTEDQAMDLLKSIMTMNVKRVQ